MGKKSTEMEFEHDWTKRNGFFFNKKSSEMEIEPRETRVFFYTHPSADNADRRMLLQVLRWVKKNQKEQIHETNILNSH